MFDVVSVKIYIAFIDGLYFQCGKECINEDVIMINGTVEDVVLMRERMEQRKLQAKQEKKVGKSKVKQEKSQKRLKTKLN